LSRTLPHDAARTAPRFCLRCRVPPHCNTLLHCQALPHTACRKPCHTLPHYCRTLLLTLQHTANRTATQCRSHCRIAALPHTDAAACFALGHMLESACSDGRYYKWLIIHFIHGLVCTKCPSNNIALQFNYFNLITGKFNSIISVKEIDVFFASLYY
jgi:hypothetical protein